MRVRVPLHHHAIQIVLEVTYPGALPPSGSECVRNSASTVQGHFRLGRPVDSSRCRRAPEDRQARISAVRDGWPALAPLGIGAPSCCPPCHPPCHPPCRRWHRGSRNRARIDRHHSFETNTPLRRSAWASSEASSRPSLGSPRGFRPLITWRASVGSARPIALEARCRAGDENSAFRYSS